MISAEAISARVSISMSPETYKVHERRNLSKLGQVMGNLVQMKTNNDELLAY